MSLPRMPGTGSSATGIETSESALKAELAGEIAANLGRTGAAVEATLAALAQATPGSDERRLALKAAAKAVWRYFVQREACGQRNHAAAIAHYRIPGEVLARLGAID